MVNWENINAEFTPKLQQKWEVKGFNYEQTKKWIDVGLKVSDANYAKWLRDIKKINAEQLSSESDKKELWEEYIMNSQISPEVIKQIKDFNYHDLTSQQEELITQLIPDKGLKKWYKRYKTNGLCPECDQLNTGFSSGPGCGWCQPCNSKHFQAEFKNWTSGNQVIDQLIQKYQLQATYIYGVLEWIPYGRFTHVEYLAEGGFGKVYKANWNDGLIKKWNTKSNKWERNKENWGDDRYVVLKTLNNSQNITVDFLREIINHKAFSEENAIKNVVTCYGISQDPQTGNYIMVMEYMPGGSLKHYLGNNYNKLNFGDKVGQLYWITDGLNSIHEKGLIHKDFHPGNILTWDFQSNHFCSLTDLGLSRPANETDKGQIYGVLPYIAPEVLRGQPYTPASDIYSFGMVAYEMFTGFPPYHGRDYDISLSLSICQGTRPEFNVKIPPLLENLIKHCWDSDPTKRPIANELNNIVWDLYVSAKNKNSEFYRQIKEAEECNQILLDYIRFPEHEKNSKAAYTSKLINTKEITEKLQSFQDSRQFDLSLDFNELSISEEDLQEQSSFQDQIEIPPKQ